MDFLDQYISNVILPGTFKLTAQGHYWGEKKTLKFIDLEKEKMNIMANDGERNNRLTCFFLGSVTN